LARSTIDLPVSGDVKYLLTLMMSSSDIVQTSTDTPLREAPVKSGSTNDNVIPSTAEVTPGPSQPRPFQRAAVDKVTPRLTSTDQKGIVFDEQTPVSSLTNLYISKKGGAVCEPDWHCNDIFRTPVRVASGTWPSTSVAGTMLYRFDFPDLIFKIDRFTKMLKRFTFFRGTFRLRVELNGTDMHAGQLLLAVRPNTLLTKNPGSTPNLSTLMQCNHITLLARANTVAEIDIPWYSVYDYMSTENSIPAPYDACTNETYATAWLVVRNTLNPGTTASTSLGWTAYVNACDIHMSIPKPSLGFAQGLFDITTINQTLNNVTDSTLPINMEGDDFDVTALDLPTDPMNPTTVTHRNFSSLSSCKGVVPTERMSMYPETMTICRYSSFETNVDEMLLSNLITIPSMLTPFTISTTSTFGTILYKQNIAPNVGYQYQRPVVRTINNSTTLGYFANMFSYWRGDIIFCIEVVGSQHHTAKLFAGYAYNVNDVPNFAIGNIDPTTYYGKVIEVNKTNQCYEVRIPYQHYTPWCPITNDSCHSSGIFARNNDAGYVYPYKSGSIGIFFVTVLNPLVVSAGIATSVDVNVTVRAGDNFEFHTPRFSSDVPMAQAGVGSAATCSEPPSILPERIRTLRDCLKRTYFAAHVPIYQPLTLTDDVPTNTWRVKTANGVAPFGYSFIDIDKTLLSLPVFNRIGSCYAAYCGDVRMKLYVNFVNSTGSAPPVYFIHVPPTAVLNIASFACSAASQTTPVDCFDPTFLAQQMSTIAESFAITTQSATLNSNFTYTPYQTIPDRVIAPTPTVPWDYDSTYTKTTYGRTRAGPALASAMATKAAPSVEIEIPYTVETRCTKIYNNAGTSQANTLMNLASTMPAYGYLLMVQPIMSDSGFGIGNTGINNPNAIVSVHMNGADTFRFGMFRGVPSTQSDLMVTVLNGTTTPYTTRPYGYMPAPIGPP